MGTKIKNLIDHTFKEQEIVLDVEQKKALDVLVEFSKNLKKQRKQRRFFWNKNPMGRGVYLYGDVGRGKTMLMDAFYDALPDDVLKTRVHFHAFMKDVHEFLHEYRQSSKSSDGVDKALPEFVARVAQGTEIICFDEFHITDVADAMILSRLFTALFDEGISIIMTSNWIPDRLYEGGLQRDRILPFIELIKKQMDIVELNGAIDYRKQILKGHKVYFSPLKETTEKNITEMVNALTKGKEKNVVTITEKGRDIHVPNAYGDVAVFTFSDLCEAPLGAGDYIAIAHRFRVIVLKEVPQIAPEKRNEAKRFMTLIDVLYDQKTLLIISADAEADKLYSGHDHAFEFDRTVSRLIEMQSQTYLEEVLQ